MLAQYPHLRRGLWCAAVVPWLAGCAGTRFLVEANRAYAPEPAHVTFRISDPPAGINAADAVWLTVSDYVRTALVHRGYLEAGAGEAPGLFIEIDYRAEPPRSVTRAVTEDVVEQVPETTVTRRKKITQPDGTVQRVKVREVIPAYEKVVGLRTTFYTETFFPKWLRIAARDVPDARRPANLRRVWFVEVRNEDMIDDLESYLVLMVAAAMRHFGDTVDKDTPVQVSLRDEHVQLLLRGGVLEER